MQTSQASLERWPTELWDNTCTLFHWWYFVRAGRENRHPTLPEGHTGRVAATRGTEGSRIKEDINTDHNRMNTDSNFPFAEQNSSLQNSCTTLRIRRGLQWLWAGLRFKQNKEMLSLACLIFFFFPTAPRQNVNRVYSGLFIFFVLICQMSMDFDIYIMGSTDYLVPSCPLPMSF